jgi:AcrR family transcriptional regulator
MFSEPENAAGAPDSGSWRDRALERSLEAPRARSVDRLERLVGAARDLANESGTSGFTVAQVAQRAGLSLKSFYRCFAGKDDLLVALLEEDSRLGAVILAGVVDAHEEPDERLRAYVVGIFELLTHPGALGYAGVLVREHRRLSEARPDEMRRALAPMVDLLASEIAGAVATPDPARDAHIVFALLLEGIHEVTLGRVAPRDEATYLWRFCRGALEGVARGDESTTEEER